jgi:ABC-type multidrug transport system fused ATPase/permease subunit
MNYFQSQISIWGHLPQKFKVGLLLISLLMVISSLVEILSIASVMPFISILLSPDSSISQNEFFDKVYFLFNIDYSHIDKFVVYLLFVFLFLLSFLLKTILLWITNFFAFRLGSNLSIKIFSNYLQQPYIKLKSTNSSEIIGVLKNKVDIVIYNVIVPSVNLISALFSIIFIALTLFYINFSITIISLILIIILYFAFSIFTKKRKFQNSKNISKETTNTIKTIKESFGSIRELILTRKYSFFSSMYGKSDMTLRHAQAKNQFFNLIPRIFIENFVIIGLASFLMIYINRYSGDIASQIPLVGLFLLSTQRLLPYIQQIYFSYSSLQSNFESFYEVLNYLNLKNQINKNDHKQLKFDKYIELKNLNFSFDIDKPLFENINLKINKGDKVGIVGSSGSGKSTFIDLLMGLLKPASGQVIIDGKIMNSRKMKQWLNSIAHVPQNVFLMDRSIKENIVFSEDVENINYEKLINVTKMAGLLDFVMSLKMKFDTIVYEDGSRLSGGQKQRIGIARALYMGRQVIFFDEATSALDLITEKKIMQSLSKFGKNYTFFIISHRKSTLSLCDYVISIDNGIIKKINEF